MVDLDYLLRNIDERQLALSNSSFAIAQSRRLAAGKISVTFYRELLEAHREYKRQQRKKKQSANTGKRFGQEPLRKMMYIAHDELANVRAGLQYQLKKGAPDADLYYVLHQYELVLEKVIRRIKNLRRDKSNDGLTLRKIVEKENAEQPRVDRHITNHGRNWWDFVPAHVRKAIIAEFDAVYGPKHMSQRVRKPFTRTELVPHRKQMLGDTAPQENAPVTPVKTDPADLDKIWEDPKAEEPTVPYAYPFESP